MTTLPESLVSSIKVLVKAHEDFTKEIEELQALANTMQTSIDRLVARHAKLESVKPGDPRPVQLPRAILPREQPDSENVA